MLNPKFDNSIYWLQLTRYSDTKQPSAYFGTFQDPQLLDIIGFSDTVSVILLTLLTFPNSKWCHCIQYVLYRCMMYLAHLVGGWRVSRYRFEDLRADVSVLGELGLDVVAGLCAVLAGVGSAGEAARVHDGG